MKSSSGCTKVGVYLDDLPSLATLIRKAIIIEDICLYEADTYKSFEVLKACSVCALNFPVRDDIIDAADTVRLCSTLVCDDRTV